VAVVQLAGRLPLSDDPFCASPVDHLEENLGDEKLVTLCLQCQVDEETCHGDCFPAHPLQKDDGVSSTKASSSSWTTLFPDHNL